MTTLDRVARSTEGADKILRTGGISAVLAALAPGREAAEELLRPAFRLLERFARDDANLKAIRENGGIEALVAQLELHSDNEALLRAGGKLLGRLAADDLEGTIKKLQDADLPPHAHEFSITLISNLALRPENIDKIVAKGGVKALKSGFEHNGAKTQAAAARALGRIARSSPAYAQEIIDEQGVKPMVAAMLKHSGEEDLLHACTSALTQLVHNPAAAIALRDKKATETILAMLKTNPGMGVVAADAMAFFERVLSQDESALGPLIGSGLMGSMIDALNANRGDGDVEIRGNKLLWKMFRNHLDMGTDADKDADKDAGKAAREWFKGGGAKILKDVLDMHANDGDVVKSTLDTLLAGVEVDPGSLEEMQKAGILGAVVRGIYAQDKNSNVLEPGRLLLKKLVSEKDAAGLAKLIIKYSKKLCADKDEETKDLLEECLMQVWV